jgi:hypothetical protein
MDESRESREHTALVMLAVRMGLLANLDWYLDHG